MPRQDITPVLHALDLGPNSEAPRPLYRRLFTALRDAILAGKLAPGSRLPATRVVAKELAVGRNTVIQAFEQLAAEGYVESRVGHGTRVTELPPDQLLRVGTPPPRNSTLPRAPTAPETASPLSERGQKLADMRRNGATTAGQAFAYGTPAIDEFPQALWGRLLSRNSRRPSDEAMVYSSCGGLSSLRHAVAQYLAPARGVICHPDQVLLLSSAQGALDLAARMLLDVGDRAWIEDPGYMGARGALVAAGAVITPVPVDEAGIDVEWGQRHDRHAKLAYVTPSTQFPTGATMSLERRLALLDWADRTGAWILEDDYDSEYRYRGKPLTALQGLDGTGRVLYIGTFSKTLFPGIRAAYLVVPEPLVAPFRRALRHTGQDGSLVIQAALADFINEGHFTTHIRRMRSLYAQRQAALVTTIEELAEEYLAVKSPEAGMQLVAYLPDIHDIDVASVAKKHGISTAALSPHYLNAPRRQGLILGFAGVPQKRYAEGIMTLVKVIQSLI